MGITIESKNHSIDLGGRGFYRLRMKVAELSALDICELYKELKEGMFLVGSERKDFINDYNKKLNKVASKYNDEKNNVLDFLYTSDCDGEMDVEHCKSLYEVIKEYDDNILYGYNGRADCATFKDFKEIVKDCIETETAMTWF